MAVNIPTINEKFLDNNGQVNSTWYNYLRTGGGSNIGDVLPNFFIVSGAYIQASNYWLNLSIDNGWLSGDTYQGAYADLLKLSDASSVNIRFTTSDARASEIATYGESGAFVLDTNNKRFKIPMVTKTIGNLSTLADIGTVFGYSAASGSAVYAGVKFPYFMKVGNKTLEASTVDLKKEAADQKAAIASLGQAQLEAISSAGNTQIALIESAGTTQVNTITSAGTIQYDAITLNGTTWKNDIIATGTLWNNTVISTGTAQVGLVEDAGTVQVGLVNTAGSTQVGLVNDAGDNQVGLVNSAGATQVGLVEDEGDTQVARVISEGTSYVTVAQNWAIKTDGPVSGSDYSSKYNADLAYTYAQSVNPDNIVHIAGTETITGLKTFTSSPIVPTPITDYQPATKLYVDKLYPTPGDILPNGATNFQLSNNATDPTNDIDIGIGYTTSSSGDAAIILPALMTKRLDANWAAGTNQGGIATGLTKTNSTWYHAFAILNPTSGVVDVWFDTSLTPTLPSGYTKSQYINSVYVQSTGIIRPFWQNGKEVIYGTGINDINVTALPSAFQDITLSTPLGKITEAIVNSGFSGASAIGAIWEIIIQNKNNSSKIITNFISSSSGINNGNYTSQRIYTNASSQIAYKSVILSGTPSSNSFTLITIGFRLI